MTNPKLIDEEKTQAHQWLITAQRFLAFLRGHVDSCRRRDCKGSAMCTAQSLDQSSEKNLCGHPLSDDEVAETVQLALFGMMLEEGLLKDDPDSDAHSRHNCEIS